MTLLRALLALGLLVGLYLLCLVLAVVDVGIVVAIVESSVIRGRPLQGNSPVMLMATIPTLWALYGVFTLRAPSGPEPGSLPVEPERAPALWAAVRELAAEIGTRPPAEIRLIAEVNAKVTEETAFLGLVGGMRRLYIGLPLLAGLSADELRVVLCHELGHYAHAHTRLGAITYRGHLTLREVIGRVALLERPVTGGRVPRVNPLIFWGWWPFLGYASLYFRLSSAVNRRQELQADAAAARVVGAEVAAEALRRSVGVLPAAWSEFVAGYLGPMRSRGCVPDDPLAVFAAMTADPGYLGALRRRLEARRPSGPARAWRYDSHPSLARRLRALGAPERPVGEGRRDPVPAAERLPCRPAGSADARSLLVPGVRADTAVLPWREWLELTAEIVATEPARRLVRAARRAGGSARPALETVLDLLGGGEAGRLAARLPALAGAEEDGGPPESEDARWRRLAGALFALAGQALVSRGRARWEMSWDGPPRLRWTEAGARAAGDVTVEDLRRAVAAAVTGGLPETERLRLYLGALGVDPGAWLSQDAGETPRRGAPAETMTVSAAADPAAREENRKKVKIAIVSGGFAAGLFLLTIVPLPFGRETPSPIPRLRPGTGLFTPSVPAFSRWAPSPGGVPGVPDLRPYGEPPNLYPYPYGSAIDGRLPEFFRRAWSEKELRRPLRRGKPGRPPVTRGR